MTFVAYVHLRHYKPADDPYFAEKFQQSGALVIAGTILVILLIWPVVPLLWRHG